MTLGNMRGRSPRSLYVNCTACGHHTTSNVCGWRDGILVHSAGHACGAPSAGTSAPSHAGLAEATKWTQDAANMTQPDIKTQIAAQLYTTLERLRADEELLAIVGSMNDTLTDMEVLRMLEEYNRTGNALRQPQ
jgi:hypothetical protein